MAEPIEVRINTSKNAEDVARTAHEADEDARCLGFRSLEVESPRGSVLQVALTVPGVKFAESVHLVTG